MQAARALHLVELAADLGHSVANHPAIGFDLRFARSAEKAEAAALALKVRPASDEPPCLIIKMGEFDLEPTLRGRRAFTENLEDQSGSVDNLGSDLFLEVLLLDWRQGCVDNKEAGAFGVDPFGKLFDLSFSKQRRWSNRTDAERPRADDLDANRLRKSLGFLDPCLCGPPRAFSRQLGNGDYRTFTPRNVNRAIAIKRVQLPSSSSGTC